MNLIGDWLSMNIYVRKSTNKLMTGDKGKILPMAVSLAIYGEYLPIPLLEESNRERGEDESKNHSLVNSDKEMNEESIHALNAYKMTDMKNTLEKEGEKEGKEKWNGEEEKGLFLRNSINDQDLILDEWIAISK